MNKVILCGNLGTDVEMRYTQNQTPVGSFSVATTSKKKDKEVTTWHKIICWSKTAENCAKYLSKGSKVLIEGEITTRTWEGKDGKKNYATEITAHSVQFLSASKGDGNKQRENTNTDYVSGFETSEVDDTPF